MVKKNKDEKNSEGKSNKNSKKYILGTAAAIVVVAVILILALTGKEKETPPPVNNSVIEQIEEIVIPPPITSYDLSAYSNNLDNYVGQEATLAGYLRWIEEKNENNAAVNKYYLVDDYNNQVILAFAGIKVDFAQYEPLFIKGETTTNAYSVEGRFVKNFNIVRFEISSITEE
ncbi:MAG: hypothetical protein ACP5N2_03005 [Candidatus Nanoarchaeia archaeon]